MDAKIKKLMVDMLVSALIIVAGIVLAALTSKDAVRICGVALAAIEVIYVIQRLIKWRKGDDAQNGTKQ